MRRRSILRELHKFADLALTLAAFVGAYYFKKCCMPFDMNGLTRTSHYFFTIFLIMVIWSISFNMTNLHKQYLKQPFANAAASLFNILSVNMIIVSMAFFLLRIQDVSRILIGTFYLFDLILLTLSAKFLTKLRKMGMVSKILIVIVDGREAARDFIVSIDQAHDSHHEVIGCLEMTGKGVGELVARDVKVIGTLDELQHHLSRQVVDELVFAGPIGRIWETQQYMAVAEAAGVRIRILPHLQRLLAFRPKFYTILPDMFYGNPTLVFRPTSAGQGALLAKTAFDYVAASILIVAFLPIFLLIACAVKAVSPGPVFYVQERCSLYGRRFGMYKFRTMVVGADAMQQDLTGLNETDGVAFKIKNDPRIIPYVGRFLRKYSLDELPNIFNVLRGDMSIVGPRPPVPNEVERYELWERRRLSMKPGLTCLWQVAPLRNSIPFKKWMEMDLQYIDNWSLGLDFSILLRTVKAAFLGYGM